MIHMSLSYRHICIHVPEYNSVGIHSTIHTPSSLLTLSPPPPAAAACEPRPNAVVSHGANLALTLSVKFSNQTESCHGRWALLIFRNTVDNQVCPFKSLYFCLGRLQLVLHNRSDTARKCLFLICPCPSLSHSCSNSLQTCLRIQILLNNAASLPHQLLN